MKNVITNVSIFKKSNGFSLIEVLMVIAILGVISTIGMVSFNGTQKKSRDTARKSDLTQFRNALETYANKSDGLYPVHTSTVAADTLCGSADLNLGLSCPRDPKNGVSPYGYRYISDSSGSRYLLYGALESPFPSTSTYFGLCSNGTTLSQSSTPTIGNCP